MGLSRLSRESLCHLSRHSAVTLSRMSMCHLSRHSTVTLSYGKSVPPVTSFYCHTVTCEYVPPVTSFHCHTVTL